ncbi:MAG: amidohydrolase family protein [Betaproteobacteria bacterium]|nr:amidohydrolase family protein [Betaproteobacteria bacterium]
MQGKIALEEHFAMDDTVEQSVRFSSQKHWAELRSRLLDACDVRLAEMDRHGIEWMVISLNSPTVQAIPDAVAARELARRANDALAAHVARRAGRFLGFAALPMQDPDAATAELTRCVRELGFRGAMVNGFTQTGDGSGLAYYDLPEYRPFWRVVESLAVPFYLHPRNPLPVDARIYDGHPWLYGPAWAFGQETAVHALRLMGSGLFDECPGLRLVLGHMGEGLPYNLWRVDNANAWLWRDVGHGYPAKKTITEYMKENVYITTAGNFSTPVLKAAIEILGEDRILFSTDWPFEDIADAATWFDRAGIGEETRRRIGRENAAALFGLD